MQSTKMSNTFLTGNKDVDREILGKLTDKELLIACQTNDYTNKKVCDETFFRNLVYNRYPATIRYKDSVKVRDWKNFYLSVIYYIDKLQKDYNFNYNEKKKEKDLSPELEYLSRKLVPSGLKYNKDKGLRWASANGHLAVVKYLVERGADIHTDNNIALSFASENGHLPVVKYLVKNKADIRADNDYALRHASEYGHLPVVKYLVERGADIHALNDDALRIASYNGHLPVVKYLVEHKANIHANNNEALRNASIKGHLKIVKYLKSLP